MQVKTKIPYSQVLLTNQVSDSSAFFAYVMQYRADMHVQFPLFVHSAKLDGYLAVEGNYRVAARRALSLSIEGLVIDTDSKQEKQKLLDLMRRREIMGDSPLVRSFLAEKCDLAEIASRLESEHEEGCYGLKLESYKLYYPELILIR